MMPEIPQGDYERLMALAFVACQAKSVLGVYDLENQLRAMTAERDDLQYRVEDLEADAGRVSHDFEGACWKKLRTLLDETGFEWESADEGVTAQNAYDHLREILSCLENQEKRLTAERDALKAQHEREKYKLRQEIVCLIAEKNKARARAERAEADLKGRNEDNASSGWQPTHLHRKTGDEYRVLHRATLEDDMTSVVVYDEIGGYTWVRATSEFYDGRFVPLPIPSDDGRPGHD